MPNCGIAANCALLSEINSQQFYTSARKGQRGVEYGEVEAGRVDGGGQHAEALSEEAAGAIGRPGDGVGVEGGGLGHGGADKQLLHKAGGSVGGGGGGRRRNEQHHVQQRVIDPELGSKCAQPKGQTCCRCSQAQSGGHVNIAKRAHGGCGAGQTHL